MKTYEEIIDYHLQELKNNITRKNKISHCYIISLLDAVKEEFTEEDYINMCKDENIKPWQI